MNKKFIVLMFLFCVFSSVNAYELIYENNNYILKENNQTKLNMQLINSECEYYNEIYEKCFTDISLNNYNLTSTEKTDLLKKTKTLFSYNNSQIKNLQFIFNNSNIQLIGLKENFKNIEWFLSFDNLITYKWGWWNSSWLICRNATIINDDLNYDFTDKDMLNFTIDTTNTTFNENGKDFRILINNVSVKWKNTSNFRLVNTEIWFHPYINISKNSSNSSIMEICYNNSNAILPEYDIINFSIDGRDFKDVKNTGSQATHPWHYTIAGMTWYVDYHNATDSYAFYIDDLTWNYFRIPQNTINYSVWIYGTDGGNNGGGKITNKDSGLSVSVDNLLNAFSWNNFSYLPINSTNNITAELLHDSTGFYIRHLFLSTSSNTPSFTPTGQNKSFFNGSIRIIFEAERILSEISPNITIPLQPIIISDFNADNSSIAKENFYLSCGFFIYAMFSKSTTINFFISLIFLILITIQKFSSFTTPYLIAQNTSISNYTTLIYQNKNFMFSDYYVIIEMIMEIMVILRLISLYKYNKQQQQQQNEVE